VPLDRKKSNEKGEVKDSKLPSALTRSMPPPLMTSTVSTPTLNASKKTVKNATNMRKKCGKNAGKNPNFLMQVQ
jgi:hypothetical protein